MPGENKNKLAVELHRDGVTLHNLGVSLRLSNIPSNTVKRFQQLTGAAHWLTSVALSTVGTVAAAASTITDHYFLHPECNGTVNIQIEDGGHVTNSLLNLPANSQSACDLTGLSNPVPVTNQTLANIFIQAEPVPGGGHPNFARVTAYCGGEACSNEVLRLCLNQTFTDALNNDKEDPNLNLVYPLVTVGFLVAGAVGYGAYKKREALKNCFSSLTGKQGYTAIDDVEENDTIKGQEVRNELYNNRL